jgi:hypothetical protein
MSQDNRHLSTQPVLGSAGFLASHRSSGDEEQLAAWALGEVAISVQVELNQRVSGDPELEAAALWQQHQAQVFRSAALVRPGDPNLRWLQRLRLVQRGLAATALLAAGTGLLRSGAAGALYDHGVRLAGGAAAGGTPSTPGSALAMMVVVAAGLVLYLHSQRLLEA